MFYRTEGSQFVSPVRMIDEQSVDIVGVRVWHIELSSRSIRYSDLPHSRTVSWWLVHKVTQINIIP
jgi:hypothetical protein